MNLSLYYCTPMINWPTLSASATPHGASVNPNISGSYGILAQTSGGFNYLPGEVLFLTADFDGGEARTAAVRDDTGVITSVSATDFLTGSFTGDNFAEVEFRSWDVSALLNDVLPDNTGAVLTTVSVGAAPGDTPEPPQNPIFWTLKTKCFETQ